MSTIETHRTKPDLENASGLAEKLRQYWSFDDGQQHTHSWHDREFFISKVLPALLQEAATGWLPIETAPRDGTFLIYGKGRNGEYITDAKMIDGKVMIFDAMSDCYGWEAETATHWMPLPEPPK